MARENFLAGLGAALTTASGLAQRNRQERRQQDLDKQAREMELARMALSRDQFALDEKAYDASQTRDARSFAKDVIEDAGPEGVLDEAGVGAVTAGGFGHRLSEPTLRIGPETQGAEVAPSRSVLPTGDQKFQLEQRANQERERAALEQRRERARMALDNEGFYKMPDLQRATVWQDAGYQGQAPMSIQEWKDREDYQLQNQLKVVDAQGANQINAATVRADAAEELLRQRLEATQGAGGNLSATAKAILTDAGTSLTSLARIRELRKTHGTSGMGPVQGRWNNLMSGVPEGGREALGSPIPEGFMDISAETASLKNRVIRAITGAAVGVQEEKRIMAEIPTETDPDDRWEAKAAATERNLNELMRRVNNPNLAVTPPVSSHGGGSTPPPAPGAPPAAAEEEYVRDANGRLVRKR